METLIKFFYKNSYTLLFIFLELFSFKLIISNNDIKRQRFVTNANSFTGFFQTKIDGVTDFFNLKEENEILFQQLSQENEKSLKLYKINTAKFQRAIDSNKVLMYEYIQSEVIRNSINLKHNHFTLNSGKKQGIEIGMAVISPQGVAGVIRDVSKNFSVAVSLLNIDFGVSAKLKHDHHFGSVKWTGEQNNELNFDFIPNRIPVKIGDTVVTSGYSFVFPKNIVIGTISKIKKDQSTSFYKLRIKPSVDFSVLNRVWIVKNLLNEELDSLYHENE